MNNPLPTGRTATVRVPATTANLGPGFDALGLALGWVDECTATVTDAGSTFDITGEGADSLPRDNDHLVMRTIRDGLDTLDVETSGLHLRAHNTIPLARGLGSSSAAITAGLGLAWGLAHPGEDLDLDWVFELAVQMEGHPDNVGPAVYGGLNIGWLGWLGNWQVTRSPVRKDVRVTAFVPEVVLETTEARDVMPTMVPLRDAISNTARTALLVHALDRNPDLLFEATEDRLHQQYRNDLYPTSLDLVNHLRGEGLAACISGAGPTVVVLHTVDRSALVDLVFTGTQARNQTFASFVSHELTVGDGLEIVH